MASAEESVDDIRRQMAEIRSQLHHDMTKVVGEASTATDWRSYVRDQPWLFLGGAFALGYILVPRRQRPEVALPVNLAEVMPAIKQEKTRQPLFWRALRTVGGLALPVAFRAAQGYALRWVEDYLTEHPPGPMPVGTRPGMSSPRDPRNPERFGYPTRG